MSADRARATNLLLTGRPGIGKSTVVTRVLELLPEARLVGFVTREVREAGQRVGFRATSLAGESRIMAHRGLVSRHRVGRYGVDVGTVDYMADTALAETAAADAWVVDEIGKMELFSDRFVRAMKRIMADARPLLATIAERGTGLIEAAARRADVELWRVDESNRGALHAQVAAWLEARIG